MFSCRYCVCNACFGTKKILKPFRMHVLKQHPLSCLCDCSCVTCASGSCRPSIVDLTWIQSHLLCPKQQLLHGSEHHYFPWSCLELKCDTCFLNKPLLLVCNHSAFTDPAVKYPISMYRDITSLIQLNLQEYPISMVLQSLQGPQ